MRIESAGGAKSYSYTPPGENSTVKLLEKQKEQLQEQKKKISESNNMDPKLKQEAIRQLDDQIADIESQIWKAKMEKLSPDSVKNSNSGSSTNALSSASNAEAETGKAAGGKKTDIGINSEHMLSAVSGYSDLKTMSKVRTDLQGQLRIATGSGENPEAGAGIQAKLNALESEMARKEKNIRADLKKAAEDGANADPTAGAVNADPAEDAANAEQTEGAENTVQTKDAAKPEQVDAAGEETQHGAKDSGELEILPEGSYIDVRV